MRELARSMASLSWAMSLFGVEQMVRIATPRRAADAFREVTHTAERELGPHLSSAFQAGDRMQRAVVDQVGNLGYELLQLGANTVYWMSGTAWRQEQGVKGWGPVPPPPQTARRGPA